MKIATIDYADIGIVQVSQSKTESRIGFAFVVPLLPLSVIAFAEVPLRSTLAALSTSKPAQR
jgi:hypothetical protein